MLSFEGNLLTQWHEISSQETIGSTLSYGKDSLNPGGRPCHSTETAVLKVMADILLALDHAW